jgi:hypothetical protein
MLTKPSAELTLFDTLSRLTFVRATKLLIHALGKGDGLPRIGRIGGKVKGWLPATYL